MEITAEKTKIRKYGELISNLNELDTKANCYRVILTEETPREFLQDIDEVQYLDYRNSKNEKLDETFDKIGKALEFLTPKTKPTLDKLKLGDSLEDALAAMLYFFVK